MMTTNKQSLQSQVISENVDFILSHFQQPLFPRKIMTKHLGYQIEVHNKHGLSLMPSTDRYPFIISISYALLHVLNGILYHQLFIA